MGNPMTDPTHFTGNVYGLNSVYNSIMFVYALLCIGIVGVSKLSVIPLITCAGGALGSGLGWYSNHNGRDPPFVPYLITNFLAEVGYATQEIGVMFYSYFILEKILSGWQRRVFLSSFWTLTTVIIALRIVIIVIADFVVFFTKRDKMQETYNRMVPAYFVLIAATEIISAGFLIYTFIKARKGSAAFGHHDKIGLFTHMIRSTELRVATLACIGLIRAPIYSIKWSNNVAYEFDWVAVVMTNMFTFLMISDRYISRIILSEGSAGSPKEKQCGVVEMVDNLEKDDSLSNGNGGKGKPQGTVDTMEQQFGPYMGATNRV